MYHECYMKWMKILYCIILRVVTEYSFPTLLFSTFIEYIIYSTVKRFENIYELLPFDQVSVLGEAFGISSVYLSYS